MRVIATTVVRESIRGKQKTGWIYDVDWEAGAVRRRLPVPEPRFPESDDNPRGGVRGGRGVAVTSAGIIVANYDTLWCFDDDWNVVGDLSHPLFVGLHEIEYEAGRLWLAATAIDAVLAVSLDDGKVEVAWDPHAPGTAARLGLGTRPHPIDGSVDYRRREAPLIDHCHINGVTRRGGATIINCGLVRRPRPSAARLAARVAAKARRALHVPERPRSERRHEGRSLVLRLNGAVEEVLLELDGHDFPTHNGQLLDDRRLALNDSTHNLLRIFRTSDAVEEQTLAIPGTWLRGLEPLLPTRLLVGTAPAALHLVDVERGQIERRLQLSHDRNEAVHGLAVCPPPEERE